MTDYEWKQVTTQIPVSLELLSDRSALIENVLAGRPLVDHLRIEQPKPTRRQRVKWRLLDYGTRISTAWAVLSGEDVHEGCDW